MGLYDRDYSRHVRVEFIGGPLDGLVHRFSQDQVFDEPQIAGAFNGETFEGAYVVMYRPGTGQWVARYTNDRQENAA